MVCQQLDFRIVCGDAHNTLERRRSFEGAEKRQTDLELLKKRVHPTPGTLCGSSTERLSTMTGKYKTSPRLVIQISASVESMTLKAAPRNPRRAQPWKTVRKTEFGRVRCCARAAASRSAGANLETPGAQELYGIGYE
jgi:hypothetical protein